MSVTSPAINASSTSDSCVSSVTSSNNSIKSNDSSCTLLIESISVQLHKLNTDDLEQVQKHIDNVLKHKVIGYNLQSVSSYEEKANNFIEATKLENTFPINELLTNDQLLQKEKFKGLVTSLSLSVKPGLSEHFSHLSSCRAYSVSHLKTWDDSQKAHGTTEGTCDSEDKAATEDETSTEIDVVFWKAKIFDMFESITDKYIDMWRTSDSRRFYADREELRLAVGRSTFDESLAEVHRTIHRCDVGNDLHAGGGNGTDGFVNAFVYFLLFH